ncbi:MAG: hypothetical protein M1835_000002 [Candelina submexicana]|nr:MAG: hypothetical protein M1835_000002 [Candelina submexicana]
MTDPSGERLANVVSRLLGWIYVACWSASFYPQPIYNFRRRSTYGLAIDFPVINILGFVTLTISNAVFLYSPLIRAQYAYRNRVSPEPTVRFNDLAFAAHGVFMTCLSYTQFWPALWGFKVDKRHQTVSRPALGVTVGSLVGLGVVCMIVALRGIDGGAEASGWAWIDAIYAIGYVKLLVTFVKYIPQAWVNYKRKSTDGWTILQILLDLSGGVFSIMQLLIDSSLQGDWSGITGNPVKLGLGNVSIFFDMIFIVQHFWLYRGSGAKETSEDVLNGEQRPLLDRRGAESV